MLKIAVVCFLLTGFLMTPLAMGAKLLDVTVLLYLPFDEGKGEVLEDSSGNGNDGQIEDCEWIDGKFGSALDFNGQDSFVRVPDSDTIDLGDQITIEVWLKSRGGTRITILSKNPEYHMDIENDIQFWVRTWGGNNGGGAPVPVNEWVHLAFTWDQKEKHMKTYVNGDEVQSQAYADTSVATESDLTIGQWEGSGMFFDGIIDELRISNTIRTEAEIEESFKGLAATSVKPGDKLATTWGIIKSTK